MGTAWVLPCGKYRPVTDPASGRWPSPSGRCWGWILRWLWTSTVAPRWREKSSGGTLRPTGAGWTGELCCERELQMKLEDCKVVSTFLPGFHHLIKFTMFSVYSHIYLHI